MKVGISRNQYPEKRCICTNTENHYVDLTYFNINQYIKRIPILKNTTNDFIFRPILDFNVDVFHSFNDVCVTNKKWVATFETMIPRFLNLLNNHITTENEVKYEYNQYVNKYLTKISKQNCLGIIAISECTKKIQLNLLEAYPKIKDSIINKIDVIYPPQEKLIEKELILNKNYDSLRLIFIGKDFYRKGGSEIVIALDELMNERKINKEQIQLTLVGDINKTHNYSFHEFQDTSKYFNKIHKIIENRDNILLIPHIENKKLLEIIKNQHIGLLTTWADTFGYSVLEFQAAGCPVITTNIRALPEINNNDIGWVIEVEKNALGEIKINSNEQKNKTRRKIIDELKVILIQCIKNKENIRDKALKSLDKIEKKHNINKYNEKLIEIYNR